MAVVAAEVATGAGGGMASYRGRTGPCGLVDEDEGTREEDGEVFWAAPS